MTGDDDVDLLIDSWSQRLTSVDLTPLDVMSRLRRAALVLTQLRREAFKESGLTDGEFDVLAALRRLDTQSSSPTRLLSLVNCDVATLKRRIARLLGRGLITRERSQSGGRGTIVALTPAGQSRVDAAMKSLIARERELLAPLSTEDLIGLERGLRQLLDRADTTRPGRPAPAED